MSGARLRGIGVDIIEVVRVARLVENGGSFRHRWFSDDEAAGCARSANPARHYAEVLAAKEAAWKALGLAWSAEVPWGRMHVVEAPEGWSMELSGTVAEAAAELGVTGVEVATSSSQTMALAIALAWIS
jgi:holo-[acyl-carrier protein] synthase